MGMLNVRKGDFDFIAIRLINEYYSAVYKNNESQYFNKFGAMGVFFIYCNVVLSYK